MELVAVDLDGGGRKNGRMTKDERKRIGRKLRAMRTERGLDQLDVAQDPKSGISVGTLQAIESYWYDVRDTNIEKYARFFGKTTKQILQADEPRAVTPEDPLLEGLHEEHLEVARNYMKARKRVRAGVELLLAHHPQEEQLTCLLMKLERLPAERLAQIDAWISADPDGHLEHLLERVRRRLQVDPTYADLTKEHLDLFDARTTPTKTPAQKKTQIAPPRKA